MYLEEIPANRSHSLRSSLAFRGQVLEDGRGLYIGPLFKADTFGGFRIKFLKHEVGHRADFVEPAAKHHAWFECVGVTLWTIMRPECFLDEDGVVEYRTQRQQHQLL